MKIAFDVDGTLINADGNPPYKGWYDPDAPKEIPNTWVIEMLKGFKRAGHTIVVWSGGGKQYAEQIVRDLKLTEFVDLIISKFENDGSIDICFDDQNVTLAQVNIKV